MSLYSPKVANPITIKRMAKHTLQGPGDSQAIGYHIKGSTRLRNRKRNDGLLSCLSSGLWNPYPSGYGDLYLSCSVGIVILIRSCRTPI